jgi:hypothetical protein
MHQLSVLVSAMQETIMMLGIRKSVKNRKELGVLGRSVVSFCHTPKKTLYFQKKIHIQSIKCPEVVAMGNQSTLFSIFGGLKTETFMLSHELKEEHLGILQDIHMNFK